MDNLEEDFYGPNATCWSCGRRRGPGTNCQSCGHEKGLSGWCYCPKCIPPTCSETSEQMQVLGIKRYLATCACGWRAEVWSRRWPDRDPWMAHVREALLAFARTLPEPPSGWRWLGLLEDHRRIGNLAERPE